ncbi:low temperature requirement protein A [Deinococcus aerius]|uniref:Low temperature requirement protein A n=1 Tax=Deinococcus aerius TaxID=200253 RepID=A0A2I9DHF1_9DEIO|nr:low temperature requirement protein A [Deinococcus aerius]GBF05628.1 low temperature requirement protein A [Deinococcus aerius]
MVLIALGESIVAIGTGARGLALNATLVTAAALGLALAGALWWTYFDRDDQRAERRMDALPDGERARLALAGFGYGHYLMLAGIIVLAAGIKGVVAHPADHAEPHVAWCLGGGLALYLAGDVLFRRLMGLGPGRLRLLAAVGALLTVPLALADGGLVQLGACVALLVLLLLAEAGRRTVKLT